MGELARKTFARTLAVLGLSAATILGIAGTAGAAPADRAGDPVVLNGSQLSRLNGVAPGKILAYKWAGKWIQVPVQIDERHKVPARSLYPEDAASKYILDLVPFEMEVYADPKTRSGADEDPGFDADDELVFMAGDSGRAAPAKAALPSGVGPAGATKIAVDDPVGGGKAYVYLFQAPVKWDQSAGKDYVKYDFKLTGLGAGQTLLNDYGYSNSSNPEDSTVTTADYQLHSTDRWMEDELKISAGGASGANILDREAVSAGGLNGCGRSEYTFSGNWDLDANVGNERPADDDEGTYVAIKDGPVRAIRSYMGANSGPYVQAVHKYYADHEDKSIIVRVHPIPDMYVWTDLSAAASGMTYRDQLNRSGVAVDGSPDSLAKPGADGIGSGNLFWQQVTGAQGSATTLVSATASVIDGDNPPFVAYYLDDQNPDGPGEKQCGGDLKAYGAAGFGIDGTFPNTDPNLAPVLVNSRDLTVDRVRYFGGPGATAEQADVFAERVKEPLTATAGKADVREQRAKLGLRLVNRKVKARPGRIVKLRVRAINTGNVTMKRAKVCAGSRSFAKSPCARLANLAPGKSRTLTLRAKVKKNAKGRRVAFFLSYEGKGGDYGVVGVGGGYKIALRR
ncbi:MAG: hypothetical protein J0H98_01525 [Solirubrobacterales bacterium]|nr:hypothetical protein [Solirubrobacterales bacterium]